MGLRKKFGTSKEAVEQGAWIEICDNDDGTTCRFRIKRMNQQNMKFQKNMANHRNAFSGDHYSEKKLTQMAASMIEVLADTVIVDWEFMEDWRGTSTEGFPTEKEGDKYLPFNRDNLTATLVEFPDLLDLITLQAQELSNFQDKEAEAKN